MIFVDFLACAVVRLRLRAVGPGAFSVGLLCCRLFAASWFLRFSVVLGCAGVCREEWPPAPGGPWCGGVLRIVDLFWQIAGRLVGRRRAGYVLC